MTNAKEKHAEKLPLVITHNGRDGFLCGWLIHRCLYRDAAEYVAVEHGQPPPTDIEGRDIIIADTSYKREVLKDLARRSKSFHLFEHRIVSGSECKGLKGVEYDIGKCAAMLVWDWLRLTGKNRGRQEQRPKILDYVQDAELNTWQMPNCREVLAALSSYPRQFDVYNELVGLDVEHLVLEGRAIQQYKARCIEAELQKATETTFDGHRVWIVNSTMPNCGEEVAEHLAKDRPFALFYYVDGPVLVVGLRSSEHGLDVSLIAKKLGGAGYNRAAGFRTRVDRLAELLGFVSNVEPAKPEPTVEARGKKSDEKAAVATGTK